MIQYIPYVSTAQGLQAHTGQESQGTEHQEKLRQNFPEKMPLS